MIRVYADAKEALVRSGVDRAKVDAMPADTVVLAYDLMQFRQIAEEYERTGGLPYWQAAPMLHQAGDVRDGLNQQGNPLLPFLPRVARASLQYALVEREVGMLMCVEGIRAYAAGHDGTPPPTLDALSPQTPAPIDPVLGKPFGYEATGQTITLRAPAPPGQPARLERVYRITLAR
jgi:hypothetical protein